MWNVFIYIYKYSQFIYDHTRSVIVSMSALIWSYLSSNILQFKQIYIDKDDNDIVNDKNDNENDIWTKAIAYIVSVLNFRVNCASERARLVVLA